MNRNRKPYIMIILLIFSLIFTGCNGGGGLVPDTTPDQDSDSEGMHFIIDTNPESALLCLAGKEGGEKVMSFGSKDAQGNILELNGAAYVNEMGDGLVIEIDENGYPTRMADTDGNKLTFQNYTASTVDITVYDFNWNLVAGPFTVDIDSDLLNELTQLYSTTKGSHLISRDAHFVAKLLKVTSLGLKLAGCATSIFGAAFVAPGTAGFSLLVPVFVCGSATVSLIQAFNPDAIPLSAVESALIGYANFNVMSAIEGTISPTGLASLLTGIASDVVETYATKSDIIEFHKLFIKALESQNWNQAWKYCHLRSEAQIMVNDVENLFENNGWNTDNTTVDISFVDTNISIEDRPIAYIYSNTIITLEHEGSTDKVISGEGLFTELEEYLTENHWGVTKSGILDLLKDGVSQINNESEDTSTPTGINGTISVNAWDIFSLAELLTAKVIVKNTGNIGHTFTVKGIDSPEPVGLAFSDGENEASVYLAPGDESSLYFDYFCHGSSTANRTLVFRLYENEDDPTSDYLDEDTKVIFYDSGTTLSAPTGVDASDGDYSQSMVKISWNPVSGASYYKIYRSTSIDGTKNAISNWFSDNDCEVYDSVSTGLIPGIHYFYWVKAATSSSGANESSYSDPDEGWLYTSTPISAPTGVTATKGTRKDLVRISWDYVTEASHYKIYRSSTETGTKTAISLWRTDINFGYDKTATPGTHYFYWVKAATSDTGANASAYSEPDEGWLPPCEFWTASQSGTGDGTKIDTYDISDLVANTKINFIFDAENIPDKWYISYNGVVVHYTGWRGDSSYDGDPLYPGGVISPGNGHVLGVIKKDSGDSHIIQVRTESKDPGTAWNYRLETDC